MCTTEEKLLIAYKPFIKKSAARKLTGVTYSRFVPIWDQACKDYTKEMKAPLSPLGLPTEYYLKKIGVSVMQLERLAEYEKRFSE